MELQAVKQRLPKRILRRINEEQLRTSLDKLKPPSFAKHAVDSGEFLVSPAPRTAQRSNSFALTNPLYPAILPVIEVDFYGASAPFVLEQSHVWYEASRASQRGLIF